jgi:hypothetical protein
LDVLAMNGLAIRFSPPQSVWLLFTGYLKNSMYKNSPQIVVEPKEGIYSVDIRITTHALKQFSSLTKNGLRCMWFTFWTCDSTVPINAKIIPVH